MYVKCTVKSKKVMLVKGCSFISVTFFTYVFWLNNILSAMPGNIQHRKLSVGYSIGTSNSAALISHEASLWYDCLSEVFESKTGFGIPREYAAVL